MILLLLTYLILILFRASGEKDKVVSWLPPNKQFLITKNVPCLKRAKSLDVDTDEKDVEDDWVETHISHTSTLFSMKSILIDD